jgi:3-carboxy-cis,cis-muconate cycloisomerase
MMRLTESLTTTEQLAKRFSDRSMLQAMLDFEVALARAEERHGIIPPSAADAIAKVALADNFDATVIAHETQRAGTPGIPLVKALTERVRAVDPAAAGFVHWGATSQDVADTALILLLKRAQPLLAADYARLDAALRRLSDRHAGTVMLGRTLLQAAPPITFGLKAAGWLAALRRGWSRVAETFDQALVLQFGGASGTLAALGDRGLDIADALAEQLGLAVPDAPWHAHRDRLAALLTACAMYVGSLGKMARDISLLMQSEVSEAAEPGGDGRGGSSTMPHKRNPIACAITLAAANRVPGLVATFLSGMTQEHERGVGGWHAEWPAVTAVIQSTGVAVASIVEAAEGLVVDEGRMRANIDATRGVVFAERAVMMLGSSLGRDGAHQVLEDATKRSVAERRRLVDVLADIPEVTRHLSPEALRDLDSPESYLGVSERFRQRQVFPRARLFYRIHGSDTLPVLMLAHSIGNDHGLWDLQIPALVPHFCIVRYDSRGHGASEIPPGDYSMQQLGRDVLELADQLGIERFAFCGLSLGGMVGQWIAAEAGDRVTHVVLANTSPRFADSAFWESRRHTVLERGMSSIAGSAVERSFGPQMIQRRDAHIATFQRTFVATDPKGYAGCCAAIRDMDHTALLRTIRVPTLIIAGDHDLPTPWEGHGDVLAREIPGARVVHLAAGHLSNLEQPEAFSSAIIDFLKT